MKQADINNSWAASKKPNHRPHMTSAILHATYKTATTTTAFWLFLIRPYFEKYLSWIYLSMAIIEIMVKENWAKKYLRVSAIVVVSFSLPYASS